MVAYITSANQHLIEQESTQNFPTKFHLTFIIVKDLLTKIRIISIQAANN